jgi:hypothetical protein
LTYEKVVHQARKVSSIEVEEAVEPGYLARVARR